ncbi:MAG: CRTAC1 family protein [Gemmataceae bacterium]|nr:CRTAC1 family protein [Gemmataceae bacterium]
MPPASLISRPPFGLAVSVGLSMVLAGGGCSPSAPAGPPAPSGPAAHEPEAPPGPPLFEDVTTASGVNFRYRNGEDTADHLSILESLGGGAALVDYDGDGQLDLFLPGGGGFAGQQKRDIVGNPCKLYRNLGGAKFEDVTEAVGLGGLAGGRPWFYSHGAAVADTDRDGWPDLLVTGWGAVALFRNVPVDPAAPAKGRRFVDVTAAAGLGEGIAWATSAAFADLDADGFPDLYLCQYVDWSWAKNPPCHYDGKTPDVCPPKQFDGLTHKLYRNTGRGAFADVSREAGLVPGGPNQSKGLGVLVVDVDGDGRPDVYVANDTVDNFLYLNKSRPGALRLDERGLKCGVARDDRGGANGSMGVDAGDPEGTGRPALWVTNYENELHALYRNDSTPDRPFFHFRSSAAGIGAIGQRFVGWGTAFLDADLDGWEDLYVANGHAIRFPTGRATARRQRPVLLLNQGGKRFADAGGRVGGYAETPRLARGVAFGDLDNDGRTDLVVSHVNEPAAVLRGTGGPDHHWIGVRLVGKDHACVVGAKAAWEAGGRRQTRFVKGGGSYASSGDRRLLFGLGAEPAGRLVVTWPDGTEQTFDGLAADRYYRITQGSAKPEREPGAGK